MRNTRYLESPATTYENSFNYRVEWDDRFNADTMQHEGPGSIYYQNDYDNAWECFCAFRDSFGFKGLRLIKIDKDNTESVIFQK